MVFGIRQEITLRLYYYIIIIYWWVGTAMRRSRVWQLAYNVLPALHVHARVPYPDDLPRNDARAGRNCRFLFFCFFFFLFSVISRSIATRPRTCRRERYSIAHAHIKKFRILILKSVMIGLSEMFYSKIQQGRKCDRATHPAKTWLTCYSSLWKHYL